ncbi:Uncharacterised protein [BD1-7 clade bacterium]|uniref:Glycosyltransferase RgtA/B/C/D-like domain-containing protein n=1 Tax=BD1-7 clade bacterium TaxID=2029982 RepID=A0A5S9MV29_9GAMM|nr:Uncharacterised protein [BD1-7 clade bacterium]CAA0083500.1 Uncharacterised protein [BD1-7 clade bacterium]
MKENQLPNYLPARLQWVWHMRLRHLLVLALILCSPALVSGLMGDDLLHWLLLSQHMPVTPIDDYSLFNLFSFVDTSPERQQQLKQVSMLAWWAAPDFYWLFWRPLAEASHYIDYVWLQQPWLMHLHSLLWYGLLIVLAHRSFKLFIPSHQLALLATALYALDGAHGLTVSWISNRNALMATTFALICLLAYDHHRRTHSFTAWTISVFMLVAALLSGELAVGIGGWLLAYALFVDQQPRLNAFVRLLPFLVIVIGWAWLYREGGFGTSEHTRFYIAPLQRPEAFLLAASERIPAIAAALFSGIPADITGNLKIQWPITLVGALLIAGLLYGLWRSDNARAFQALMLATLITAIPVCASPPQDRNLLMVSLGGSAMLAIWLRELYLRMRTHRIARYSFWTLVILHLVLSPLSLPLITYAPALLNQAGEKRAQTFPLNTHQRTLILGGDMMEMVYLLPNLQRLHIADRPLPTHIVNLVGSDTDYTWTQTPDGALSISAPDGLLSNGDQMVRDLDVAPFQTGDTIYVEGAEIRISNTNAIGQPTRIRVTLNDPDDWQILQWTRAGYQVAKPVGHHNVQSTPGESR